MAAQSFNLRSFATAVVTVSAFICGPANATPVLTGALVDDVSNTFVWSTNSYGYYLFLADGSVGGPIINAANGHIGFALTPGTNTFYMFGDWDRGTPKDEPWGLILSFDGQPASLSVNQALIAQTEIVATTSEASSAFVSQALSPAWPGSFAYSSGGYLVTLDDFNIFVADKTDFDRVSPTNVSANGRDDAVGKFTLSVTPIPEPSSWPTLMLGILGIGVMVRRRSKIA